ncbi:MAG TPA: RNA polymerase sigma-70 factor [Lysobacter sp.]
MDDATATFKRLQPRMLGVAYRMLGSLAEAEDIVQDVWLRWHDTDPSQVDNAEAWLTAATTRRAIDRLRLARTDREQYVGIWLPEPILTEGPSTPEQVQEASSDLSVAFLAVLERLAPEARAAFLLHEVFEADYAQIAAILGKSEAACRQIVRRAKQQLREERPRYTVSSEVHRHLLQRFLDALAQGNLEGMKDLMAESATLVGDGGGIVSSFPEPMVGGERIAAFLFAPTLRPEQGLRLEPTMINGRLGLLRYMDGKLESAQSFETDGERIVQVFVQRNPEKLRLILGQHVAAIR